jgi:hypothetical protein
MPRGDKPKAQLARRRGDEQSWLFESVDRNLSKMLQHNFASYAGLTRVSIILHKGLSKRMDCRVKPGNDECSFPGRDAAFFMPLRRTGTPVSSSRE